MSPVKKKKKKATLTVKSGKKAKLDIGEFREKTKDIDIVLGVTTVAEAVAKAGYSVPAEKTANQEGWRLNKKVCTWTDKITGKNPSLYRIPAVKAG